ncbi:DHA2 family efflux MFS transporter permease subunit [Aquihabitans sp. G128]|uniref:MFS transporter n=1 Tax=Aquihabitans sp. G128 TaxID=2849779 RepID=UPI001C213BA3|nr:MFS transporter [Aquihabitans sp. G128]QXC63187.1 DHA2 family efflux MFS transporter permease subunit [Aquihabitans sp. G128]
MRAALRDPEVAYQRRWLTLLVLCISLMVIGLDNTILNVALPTLAKTGADGGLAASSSQLQWIVDSYTIVFAGLLLTAGSLGDRFGRYRFLAVGLVIFGVGSGLSALASDANVLIATRALMGIGGACIMPSTLSILTNVFTDPAERGKAIGIWAGVSAIGIGVGPVAGGFLLTHFWWGSVFLVNVPVVIVGLVLGFLLVPESKDPSTPHLDPVGAILSILGLGALLWSIIEAPSNGWGDPKTIAGFVVGFAILGAFLAWELHSTHPMLDVRFFENPRFSAASGAVTLTFFALFGVVFLLTQYLQSVLDYSTIKAGAVLIPMSVVMMIAAPMSNIWTVRFGNKRVVATGLALVALSMLTFLTLQVDSSTIHVIGTTLLLGLGMGNIMAPATDSIMGSLPRAKAGVGSAVNDTTRQVGGAVGVAVMGSILSSIYGSRMTERLTDAGVPAGARGPLSDSIGKTLGILESKQGRPFADTVTPLAHQSFVNGIHAAAVVAAVVLLIGMGAVLRWLPARARDEAAPGTEAAAVDVDGLDVAGELVD